MTNQANYTYSFMGADRLGFGFFGGSPTPTGLFLVFLALAAVAYLAMNKKRASSRGKTVVLIAYIAIVTGVAFTYSRGAMSALFCSLVLSVLFFKPGARRWLLLIYLTTVCVFLFVPKSAMRIQSALDIDKDKSIKNRLDLWKGTCYSIVRHFPATGGAYRLGVEYEKYWQPLGFRHNYYTPVNLWLTIYAFGGPFIFSGALFLYLILIATSFLGAWSNNMPSCLYSFLTLIAFGVGNFFSTVVQIPLLAIFLISCAIPIVYLSENRSRLVLPSKNILLAGILITAISCLSLGGPFFVRLLYPEKVSQKLQNITLSSGSISQIEWFRPKDVIGNEKLVLIFFSPRDFEIDIISGRLARAFCERGYIACLVNVSDGLKELFQILEIQAFRDMLLIGISEMCTPLLNQIAEMPDDIFKIEGIGLILPKEGPPYCNISRLSMIPIAVLTDTEEDSIERMRLLSAFGKFRVWKLFQLETELQETIFVNNFLPFVSISTK